MSSKDVYIAQGSGVVGPDLAAVERAGKFDFFKVENEGKPYYHSSLDGEKALPVGFRVGGVLLEQYKNGCEGELVVNGDSIERHCKTMKDDVYAGMGVAPPKGTDVFGNGEFKITRREAERLVGTVKVSTCLPKKFYNVLVGTFLWRYPVFFEVFRAVALKDLVDDSTWGETLKSLTETVEGEIQIARNRMEKSKSDVGIVHRNEFRIEIHEKLRSLLADHETVTKIRQKFQKWVKTRLLTHPTEYGCTSRTHAESILEMSLTELGTYVCVTQQGYFLTVKNNVLPEVGTRPPVVTFLSAPGIDFCCPRSACRELGKYFTPEKQFTPVGRRALFERVSGLYRVIYSGAKEQGVKSLSMLPLGLGVFLHELEQGVRGEVAEEYFKAQFEVLREGWGFDNFYINAQRDVALAKRVLSELVAANGPLPCNVVFHEKDAKFVASELAAATPTGFLNPSDSQAVMQGSLGMYWEYGRSWNYAGEEDWAATSTGLLGQFNICWEKLGLITEPVV